MAESFALSNLLSTLYQGQSLTMREAEYAFSEVVKGHVDDITLSSMLTALKIKGETPNEIAGAARALIANATHFPTPDYAFADIVGTGGDGHNTINISSAAAVVAASCGVAVAKHGNRSVSSKSGSADFFRESGLALGMSADIARTCLDESHFCFLFAPNYHAGIKHAMPVRTTLKIRTLFNLLGPLVNPAKPTHIMIGVYSPELVTPFAETLRLLGYQNAYVVHGSGLDELAIHGESTIAHLQNETISYKTVTPEDFGLRQFSLSAIEGGEPEYNKRLIWDVLEGRGEAAHVEAIALNAAALLVLTEKAPDYKTAAIMAKDAMQSGKAAKTLHLSASLSMQEK
ncbi:anthranilate phosphoribosyltransferase [Aestuariibacter sp. AA17]|uniref:Anthranilate phosphoribosyltransferase n=1 Tax=Fluctibacter corallii TaxID=2984329 RepID=A0ABT3A5B4_9ALTE|nr:anthranilate phosphoribosyltransferase [Aestuariibacter sp. AA17]MCV2883860.1 anthranilate phosphoribosyltransferase [Aestuariibacter sp. AA17]